MKSRFNQVNPVTMHMPKYPNRGTLQERGAKLASSMKTMQQFETHDQQILQMPSKDIKLPPSLKQVEVPKKECNKRTVEFY